MASSAFYYHVAECKVMKKMLFHKFSCEKIATNIKKAKEFRKTEPSFLIIHC